MDKPHEFDAERFENLITEDKLLQVLEELRYFTKGRNTEIYNELILYLNNVNAVRKERGLGLISFRQEQREKNRIIIRLIQLINDLKKAYNKNRFIIEIEGTIEDFTDDKKFKVANSVSNLLGKVKIKGIYPGSIKIVFEAINEDIELIIDRFNSNPIEINTLMGDIEVLNIKDEKQLFKEIALIFYGLFISVKSDGISKKELIESLQKFNLLDNFNKSYLRGADLSGVNLSGTDLSGVNLSGANLRYADLRNAELKNTDLRGADLRGVYLSVNDLSGVNLSYANLSNMYLINADLSYANLSYSDLIGVNLSYSDLSGANLSYANLSYANLNRTDLSGANLYKAIVSPSELLNVKSLYQCTGLGTTIIDKISETRPNLLDPPKDEGDNHFLMR